MDIWGSENFGSYKSNWGSDSPTKVILGEAGANWYDLNYLDPDTYKATLQLPVEAGDPSQEVVYTTAEPFYETDNDYWIPWNNKTIGFIVSQQQTSSDISVFNDYGLHLYHGLKL